MSVWFDERQKQSVNRYLDWNNFKEGSSYLIDHGFTIACLCVIDDSIVAVWNFPKELPFFRRIYNRFMYWIHCIRIGR